MEQATAAHWALSDRRSLSSAAELFANPSKFNRLFPTSPLVARSRGPGTRLARVAESTCGRSECSTTTSSHPASAEASPEHGIRCVPAPCSVPGQADHRTTRAVAARKSECVVTNWTSGAGWRWASAVSARLLSFPTDSLPRDRFRADPPFVRTSSRASAPTAQCQRPSAGPWTAETLVCTKTSAAQRAQISVGRPVVPAKPRARAVCDLRV